MATSKKKQQQKEREEAFQRVQKGQEIQRQEYGEEDLVALKIQNKIKPFLRFSLLHSWRTKKKAYIASSVICILATGLYIWQKRADLAILFGVLAVFFPLLLGALHMFSARMQLKGDKEFCETEHIYIFRENEFVGKSKYGKREAKFSVEYSKVLEAIDRDDFVYLYIDPANAFVIEKANYLVGDRAELERLLGKINGYIKSK